MRCPHVAYGAQCVHEAGHDGACRSDTRAAAPNPDSPSVRTKPDWWGILEAAASHCEFADPKRCAAHLAPKLRDLAKRIVAVRE